jgi:N-acetylgalactosamine-N,N'-diacetylbacillosaminyl-diphospho-undecaprenol 4-alpha-N-acetylgalactosaminyltransferase
MNDTIFYKVQENVEVVFLENSKPFESGIKKLLKLPFLALKYKKLLKEKNIDISLSFMNRPNYVNVLAKLLGSKSKTIISERAMPSLQHKNGLQGFINRFLIRNLYKKADLVISNSIGNQKDLKETFKVKAKIIYNVLDFNCEKREKFKKFTFINVGRLDEGKNHKLLIKAFKKAGIEADLLIIGDGPLRGELENLVNNLNLEEKVKFLGKRNNVNYMLAKSHCFVFSSNYEGFPNVLLEALACNLPVISTDCLSGPREILAPNTEYKNIKDIEIAEYGILVPVNNEEKLAKAMKLIYEDNELRYNFRNKAKNRAKEFEVKRIIKEWEKIIKKSYNG